MDNILVKDVGEKFVVKELTSVLQADPRLIGGFGSDSGVLNIDLNDEYLLMNTDRSGMNIAYQMGLADGSCVGDFGVSHAVSDIYASGGEPFAVSVALFLTEDMTMGFVKQIMDGAQQAAKRYGAFIASGDTKKGKKFSMVVTAVGKCKKNHVLTRKGAQEGDYLVITGNSGVMLTGLLVLEKNIPVSSAEKEILTNAIVYQNPPYKFPRNLMDNSMTHAGMDNSDGLISSIYSLSEQSNLGIIINEEAIPCLDVTKKIAHDLDINPFQLCIGSGDWQHIFAVDKNQIDKFIKIAQESNNKVTVIGQFINNKYTALKNKNGFFALKRLENDRFKTSGKKWFEYLSSKIVYTGDKINERDLF